MYVLKKSSQGTLKEKCREFWNNYEWENKSSFLGFYQKVAREPDAPREELIIKRPIIPYKYIERKYEWKHKELWEWYNSYPNPEVKFAQFVSRVNDWGYPKEIAITNWEAWEKARAEKASRIITKKVYSPTYSSTPMKKTIENEDDLYIKIKYPKAVARVFASEYENIIDDLEWRVRNAPTKEERSELDWQLNKVRVEFMVFKCYNNM